MLAWGIYSLKFSARKTMEEEERRKGKYQKKMQLQYFNRKCLILFTTTFSRIRREDKDISIPQTCQICPFPVKEWLLLHIMGLQRVVCLWFTKAGWKWVERKSAKMDKYPSAFWHDNRVRSNIVLDLGFALCLLCCLINLYHMQGAVQIQNNPVALFSQSLHVKSKMKWEGRTEFKVMCEQRA